MRKTENFKERIPLVDEVALIVLFDLGLLECLFSISHKVAITKRSISDLQMLAQETFYSPYAAKAKDIVELLSKHIDQIQQPSSKNLKDSKDNNNIFGKLDQIKSIYDPSIYILYTDDAISRLYFCGEDHFKDTISTIDIIAILRDQRKISNKEAAEKYAKLCAFNVIGVPINYQDILIVLEDDLPKGESIKRYSERLENHENFNLFINALWWFKGDYKKALTEIGQFLSYMISGEDEISVEQNIITAIWYVWYLKVQFIIRAETDKLHFLTNSFLSTCIALLKRIGPDYKNTKYWVQAWSTYNDIINLIYGNNMSREIEDRSKTLLAQMIAKVELKSNTNTFTVIALGLTSGTAESDLFQKAYSNYRIFLQTKNNIN